MQRDLADGHIHITGTTDGVHNVHANGIANGTTTSNGTESPAQIEDLDAIVIGAGFAGVYLLHKLRTAGFKAKIIEAGSGLGGIWWWNSVSLFPNVQLHNQIPSNLHV